MKQVVLSILCTLLYVSLFAQQVVFEVTPNPMESSFISDLSNLNESQICYARIKNTSGQKKNLRWVIEAVKAPKNWRFSVCDQNNCYHTFNHTNVDLSNGYPNKPLVLMPGDTSRLWLNVFPNGMEGKAEVKVHLYDINNGNSAIATALFKVTIEADAPLTVTERGRLRITPNPVTDYMYLTNNTFVRQLWVSNILGKRVKVFDISTEGRYDVSDLPDGMYLVSMIDASQKTVKTVRVSKRAIRP
jgi:hypothetical protein